jgi:hypothetical protein
MRYVCLLALLLPLPPAQAQDGADIYKERCAAAFRRVTQKIGR